MNVADQVRTMKPPSDCIMLTSLIGPSVSIWV